MYFVKEDIAADWGSGVSLHRLPRRPQTITGMRAQQSVPSADAMSRHLTCPRSLDHPLFRLETSDYEKLYRGVSETLLRI